MRPIVPSVTPLPSFASAPRLPAPLPPNPIAALVSRVFAGVRGGKRSR